MKTKPYLLSLLMVVLALQACSQKDINVWETSSEGGTLVQKTEFEKLENILTNQFKRDINLTEFNNLQGV